MANQLENFDELLKNAFDGTEVPFNESHWKELEDELNIVSPSITGYFSAISTGIVATSLVFALMLFMFSDGSQSETTLDEEVYVLTDNQGEANQSADEKQTKVASLENERKKDNAEQELVDLETLAENSESNQNSKDQGTIESSSNYEGQTGNTVSDKVNNKERLVTINGSDNNNNNNKTVVAANNDASAEKTNVRKGCTGLTIAFDASKEYGSNAKYLWNFGDGYFSNEATPSHTFNKEGVFDVSLSVTSSASGQITSNVVQAMIKIEEAPIANIDILIDGPYTISFNNKSYNASDVEWNLDGEVYGNGSSVSMSVADNTNYILQLAAINDGGCVDTLLTKVNSIKAGSEFPRAMDTSYGTVFAPGAILDEGDVTSVKIYNQRSGKLVFEGTGNKGWNGNLPSGTKAETGNYQWIMAVEQDNLVDVYHGDVELR